MKHRDVDNWTDYYTDDTQSEGMAEPMPARNRPKDTNLSDIPHTKQSGAELKRSDDERSVKKRRPKDTDLSSPANPDMAQQNAPATEEPKIKKKGSVSEMIISILSGNILSRSEVTRTYPYMIFISVLAFIYIANIFRTQSIYREHAALTEQVKKLRAESMTIASEKMKATRQSNIMVELARRGIPLEESLAPNKVIPKIQKVNR